MLIATRMLWWSLAGLSFGAALLGVYDQDAGCVMGAFGATAWFVIRASEPGQGRGAA